MDILRKELNQIYASQHLELESLDYAQLDDCRLIASGLTAATEACAVITDSAADSCLLFCGAIGKILGLTDGNFTQLSIDSSDEDLVYERIHPEDLVEKRMLEFEFFKYVDRLPVAEKLHYKATCTFRMKDHTGNFLWIDNSTQVLRLSPAGKIWLILCRYDVSPVQHPRPDINPHIINLHTGDSTELSLSERRQFVLSEREKEILRLIKDGKLSKQIAHILSISPHTVNRHRQNILQKLCVTNSAEAISAAISMKLI
ncbi:MAG: response regulator transcription factor [Muribaculaceae bacterium]